MSRDITTSMAARQCQRQECEILSGEWRIARPTQNIAKHCCTQLLWEGTSLDTVSSTRIH